VLFVSGVVTSNSTTQNSSAFQLNSRLSASHDPTHSCPNELKAEFKQNRIMMTIIICRCKPGMRLGYEKMGGFVTCPFILSQLFTIVENGCGFTVDFQRDSILGIPMNSRLFRLVNERKRSRYIDRNCMFQQEVEIDEFRTRRHKGACMRKCTAQSRIWEWFWFPKGA